MNAKFLKKNSLYGLLFGIELYSLGSLVKGSPSMPSAKKIAKTGIEILLSAKFYENLAYTTRIVLTGVLIALLIGFSISIICSMNETANMLIMPLINLIKNIPSVALFPLFIVLMGIGDISRIVVIIWNSLYAIISSTLLGLDSPDKEVIEAAQNCGATKWQVCWYIRIPLSVIHILDGLKISMGSGFIAIVVAEMLGATKGIGYMVLWSANAFKYPDMYVYILVIALVGFALNALIEKLIHFVKRRLYYGKL